VEVKRWLVAHLAGVCDSSEDGLPKVDKCNLEGKLGIQIKRSKAMLANISSTMALVKSEAAMNRGQTISATERHKNSSTSSHIKKF
jgi:hypothetical protein